jgi:hypothetical protein
MDHPDVISALRIAFLINLPCEGLLSMQKNSFNRIMYIQSAAFVLHVVKKISYLTKRKRYYPHMQM